MMKQFFIECRYRESYQDPWQNSKEIIETNNIMEWWGGDDENNELVSVVFLQDSPRQAIGRQGELNV
ncbi:hypothetical protein NVP1262O_35 [Vibrio phage 1.262.O._10N.286.51.A9]|nr:hypothetical protein NVP1262O_35 [Vibrio phage 1.262.O._10N.286.51.A9]